MTNHSPSSLEADLERFEGRENALLEIHRFNLPRFSPMFYRTNLWIHSNRVHDIVKDILPFAKQTYKDRLDDQKMLALALVHDDAEIVTGDVPLYYKERMNQEELARLKMSEQKAIKGLSAKWPETLGNYRYSDLLEHALHKNCLEAQLVSYADKMDAFCESLHEVHAGNVKFVPPAKCYVPRFAALLTNYPALDEVVGQDNPFLTPPADFDPRPLLADGKTHTLGSLNTPTNFPQYDRWRALTLQRFGADPLVRQTEFY